MAKQPTAELASELALHRERGHGQGGGEADYTAIPSCWQPRCRRATCG